MSEKGAFLITDRPRSQWLRLDTAQILKRFFFCERSIVISQAAWLPWIGPLEIKMKLPRLIWQNAQTANALRDRIFELKFPSRLLEEEGGDQALVAILDQLRLAPSLSAFLLAQAEVLLPSILESYRDYLQVSDRIADGPTYRFLGLALQEKEEQLRLINGWAQSTLAAHPEERNAATAWTRNLAEQLSANGGIGIKQSASHPKVSPIQGSRSYQIPDKPVRDPRFWECRFYWPDIVDPSYHYGEGLELQLRSAISHLNEMWAIEHGGIILSSFAQALPWEWINDSARWTYDESRHCQMGYDRLMGWGLDVSRLPLGTYIYESVTGQDPIYRLGMLYFFETKNIQFKLARAKLFHTYGDKLSEHDMDFDWADETIHAGYGKRWLKQILSVRGEDPNEREIVRERCGELVKACIASASPSEIEAIRGIAKALIGELRPVA